LFIKLVLKWQRNYRCFPHGLGASAEAAGTSTNFSAALASPTYNNGPVQSTGSLASLAPLSTESSPTHINSGPPPLINNHQSAMMMDGRVNGSTATIMSPDSEEEFQLGLNPSSHLHQPFKQEVAEGMDSAYAP